MSTTNPPKALLTDVFGTVVDWRSSVTKYLTLSASEALNSPTSSIPSGVRAAAARISWPEVAQLWRTSYYHFTRTYDPAAAQKDPSKFKTVDQHHVEALHKILVDHGLDGLWTDEEVQKISMIWHFLDPWPDSSPGLAKLNDKFETATLSNGNTALLQDLARHGNLPYKHILSGEDFGAYKPHPSVYLGAAKKLGLEPGECALVAAHLGDLKAARGCGYQTIYIERSQEEGWSKEDTEAAKQQGWVDMWISLDEGDVGFLEIASRFGI
ncbi:haloacid dehalogenase, type II [Cladophialophora bantiana CBS 173.52]|uniref:Haloacid dehalogenase, type II n=1 Tax=Cladophialophora bantiana (strain ATCC 10958 / CBS 173.52 / CDC B-1940 / NIH 8579) TaxID=1442370 RepID=A0A0D2I686_CLAB1|nr:haloacid dehalogenase, type II [Cladophialophora bantiana CBS 173.52]KIW92369.1 haloacid dehalogenase, type II [Cladophialophora bantiana CBS 173.52]